MKAQILKRVAEQGFRKFDYSRDGYGLYEDAVGDIYVCGIAGVTCLTQQYSFETINFNILVRKVGAGTEILLTA